MIVLAPANLIMVLIHDVNPSHLALIHDVNPSHLADLWLREAYLMRARPSSASRYNISPICNCGCEKHYLMRARPSGASRYKSWCGLESSLKTIRARGQVNICGFQRPDIKPSWIIKKGERFILDHKKGT